MSEDENGSDYQEEVEYEEILPIKKQSKISKDFDPGNGNLHFLPVRIAHNGHSRVDVFFDPLIEKKTGYNNGDYDFKSSFRGRVFNGKRIILSEENKLLHLRTNKEGSQYTILASKEVPDYYIWKFDEEISSNNNLLNISSILKDLEVLK
jgi:hypothetical protein